MSPPGLAGRLPPPVTTKLPWSSSPRAIQLPAKSRSGAVIVSGRDIWLFSMKLISGIETTPLTAPVALMSTRSLPYRVSGSASKEVSVKFSPKKPLVCKVMSPPCPSADDAMISLSSQAMMKYRAVIVMSPPRPTPATT